MLQHNSITLKQADDSLTKIQDNYTNYITYEASKFVEDTLEYLYHNSKYEEDDKTSIIIDINKILECVLSDIDNDIKPIQDIHSEYARYVEDNDEIPINDYIDISEYDEEDVPYVSYYTSLKIEAERIINSF